MFLLHIIMVCAQNIVLSAIIKQNTQSIASVFDVNYYYSFETKKVIWPCISYQCLHEVQLLFLANIVLAKEYGTWNSYV